MRILHYFLGFPPYRSGGLTKYAYDLMGAQVEDGNDVFALWPGKMCIADHKIYIKRQKKVRGIINYELINPLPIPLDEGIKAFEEYMRSCDISVYMRFLQDLCPDAIHIHTLMGVHQEFIFAAAALGIRTVYTTHDYFGICPKVTLYRFGDVCDDDHNCVDCVQCNYTALGLNKIKIMQSPWYRILKNSAVVRQLRKRHRRDFFANEISLASPIAKNETARLSEGYRKLRMYYTSMLENVDQIHFNSSLASDIYKKYITPRSSVIMTITHKNIVESRKKIGRKTSDKLRITMLASAKPYKGYDVLKKALDELWTEGKNDFELKIFSPVQNPSPYMIVRENGFEQTELENIFAETDVLVAPSVWYETFGFTVLEAISYGIPVIVSDHVGAKDIIGNAGVIVRAGSVKDLKQAIINIDLDKWSKAAKKVNVKNWDMFVQENYNLYRKGN